ncbi:MAG: hypothetical protein DLM60_05015 [Pseudonocardiales bacterium]|nr:MAG: hypothetical protein DLM60_05015 [Pseudonocardiales bacterium]
MSPEDLRAYVTASRARQGLPPTVTDPATLERVASVFRLVTPADESVPPQPRKRRRKPSRSEPEGAAA